MSKTTVLAILGHIYSPHTKGFDTVCDESPEAYQPNLLSACKDALECLRRMPDVDGAYRRTCIQELEQAIKLSQ